MTRDLIDRAEVLKAVQPIWGWSITAAEELEAAIAALPAVAPVVKPLVWDNDDCAEVMGFRYLLCDPSSSDDANGWYVLEETTNTVIEADGSRKAAKAAAQADYEARILAALDLTPAPVTQPTAGQRLIAAAKDALEGRVKPAPAPVQPATEKTPSQWADETVANMVDAAAQATADMPPRKPVSDVAAIREAALREAAALVHSMSRTRTHRDEDLGVVHTSHSLVDPLKVATRILALVQKEPTDDR